MFPSLRTFPVVIVLFFVSTFTDFAHIDYSNHFSRSLRHLSAIPDRLETLTFTSKTMIIKQLVNTNGREIKQTISMAPTDNRNRSDRSRRMHDVSSPSEQRVRQWEIAVTVLPRISSSANRSIDQRQRNLHGLTRFSCQSTMDRWLCHRQLIVILINYGQM